MGIDLVTLIAQIINLVVLIWLMKKFLYQPVLKMVSERQALIDEQINQAHQARQQALLQEAQYTKKVAAFDAQRTQMLSEARKEVESFKEKLRETFSARLILEEKDKILLPFLKNRGI